MDPAQIDFLCQNTASSVSDVRQTFRGYLPISEILDRFWRLQDNLSRMLEALTDHPAETIEKLEQHSKLLEEVVEVLEVSSKLQTLRSIAAVRGAGESISSSLLEIQYLRQSRTLAATA